MIGGDALAASMIGEFGYLSGFQRVPDLGVKMQWTQTIWRLSAQQSGAGQIYDRRSAKPITPL
jgi:hypothetical protein